MRTGGLQAWTPLVFRARVLFKTDSKNFRRQIRPPTSTFSTRTEDPTHVLNCPPLRGAGSMIEKISKRSLNAS